jgi:uncharacterized protein YfaS (alpha-2-macroglobulin family)
MKKFICSLLATAFISANAFAYNYYLSCYRIFAEDEEVVASIYSYNYQRKSVGKELQMALYKVNNPEDFFNNQVMKNYNANMPDSLMQTLPLVKTWKYEFKNRYNNNIKIGKLEEGAYVLEAIGGGEISQIPLFVTNYGIITKSVGNDVLAYVTHKKTGKAVNDFKAYAYLNNETIEASEYSKGIAYFDLEKSTSANRYYSYAPIVASKDGKVAVTQSYFYYYYGQQGAGGKDYMFTDRSVYRPEQWVYFKGVFRERNGFEYTIPKGDSVIYRVLDKDWKEVAKKKVKLDKQGGFTDSIYVEKSFKLGTYSIYTNFSDNNGQYRYYYGNNKSTCTFNVEEYKKPEYEVNVTLDKEQYLVGEEIDAEIDAKYFFGSPVANADVEYKVMREDYNVPYYYRYRYSWWYSAYYDSYYTSNKAVIKSGTGKIGEDGKFKIKIPTADKQNKNYRYTIIADVRDASRRTINGSSSVIVANTEYTISAQSEKYYYNHDEEVTINLSALDYSNQPVEAKMIAKLYNNHQREAGSKAILKKEITTNPITGTAQIKFKPEQTGYYYIELESTDSRKRKTTAYCYAYVLKEGDNYYSWWNQSSGYVQIMSDKKVYNSGEKVKAMIYVPHDVEALVTVNNNKMAYYNVHRFTNRNAEDDVKGSYREFEFDIDKNAYGKLDIYVCYMKDNQFYQRQENITVIPQEQYLNVEVVFDEASYKPGNFAHAKVKVTDFNGKPVPNASVTLGTIDESIFSMYPDKTQDIRTAFYGEEGYYNYNTYQNNYSTYNYSHNMDVRGIAWRKEKLNLNFGREVYLAKEQWYHHYYNSNSSEKPIVRGYVLDYKAGTPIPKAQISIGNKKFYTDKNGYYAIHGFKKSHSTFKFTHKGHTTTIKNLAINSHQDIALNVAISTKDKSITIVEDPTITDIVEQQNAVGVTATLAGEVDDLSVVEDEVSMETFASGSTGRAMSKTAAPASVVAGYKDSDNKRFKNKEEKGGLFDDRTKADANEFKEAAVRAKFKDAIYWNGDVTTNPWGEATVRIKLPDNLTTWRTTARVITPDTKVGQSVAKIVVRKELLVRMETPRFMTMGDEMLIATNIHNYLDSPKEVKVKLLADGISVEGQEQVITVAANAEMRIDWKINSKWALNNTKLTVHALTNEESDAMETTVPVLPHGLEMITAKSAYLNNGETENLSIEIPQGVDLNSASLEISTAPSVTAAMLSSMDDLIGYPYGCVEQTMSRFLPNVIVANTLRDLGQDYVSSIDADELKKMVAQGVKRLKELQHNDGGWGWWENDKSHPFMTAYVFNGLYLARKAGYDIDPTSYNKAMNAFKNQILSGRTDDPTTNAYQMAIAMNAGMTELWDKKKVKEDDANPYQSALWLQAATLAQDQDLAKKMIANLEKVAIKEGSSIHWGGKKFYYSWQDDQVETTANVVKALSMYDADHPFIPDAVQWLMNQRKGKSWHNTRQTAMTIYSFSELIKKEINPDFELMIYANGSFVDKIRIKKEDIYKKGKTYELKGESFYASTDNKTANDKMNVLINGKNDIKLVIKGKGSSYVNTKLKYFLNGTDQMSQEVLENQPFKVKRDYYRLVKKTNSNGRVIYKKEPLRFNDIKSGDDIMVKVKITSKSAHEYVLIEDPIPAGCEFIRDPKGYIIPGEANYSENNNYWNHRYWGYWNWNRWYAHREYRDSKLAMTVTHLPGGDYEYSYLLKAQIPGTFKITPAVAQLMYYPENRGFSTFGELTIKE